MAQDNSPNPSETYYKISRGETESRLDIRICAPNLRSENLSLATWGASYVLANVLHRIAVETNSVSNDNLPLLELGAGTGLAGLSAAVVWKRNVILTDQSGIVPGLAQNIEANQELLAAAGTRAICGTLDWNSPSCLTLNEEDGMSTLFSSSSQVDVILAADVVYDSDHPKMLAYTIFAWLRRSDKSRVVIAYPLRVAYLDAIRELWVRLESGGLISIQEGRVDSGDEFDDESLIEWAVFKWNNQ